MKKGYKIILFLVVLLIVVFLIYFNKEDKTEIGLVSETGSQENQEISEPVRYFSPSSDKIMISASTQILYTDNPVTVLTYYAVDSLDKPVHFREDGRAFVRILGITKLFTNNTEIFHPESDGSKDDTLFSGKISIPYSGTYLIKVCLGKSINLNSEGTMVWPFGCFEDQASVQINVYKKD